jgi:hypothetical protein
MEKSIFVLLVNAGDSDCQATVNDLFVKASHPGRIFLGMYHMGNTSIVPPPGVDADRVRVARQTSDVFPGGPAARHAAQQLYAGEEYILIGESHMRFVTGWDYKFISMLARCDSPSPVLSSHPAYFAPPNIVEELALPTYLKTAHGDGASDIRVEAERVTIAPNAPLRGAFVSTSLLFARGDLFTRVPLDPYMDEAQSEISLSARLYTHGFDVYHPSKVLAYRLPLDNHFAAPDPECGKMRFAYMRNALAHTKSEYLSDLDQYAWGVTRSLDAFEHFSGVRLKSNTTTPRADNAEFIENLDKYLPAPLAGLATPEDVDTIVTFTESVLKKEPPLLNVSVEGLSGAKIVADTPPGILIVKEYLSREACERIVAYAESQTAKPIGVNIFDAKNNTIDGMALDRTRLTEHVKIDGMACDIINLFNDVFCNRVAPFYDVAFQYYERPQILRYPVGGHYAVHADSECWNKDLQRWTRTSARDYSVVLYLNDDFEGGEFEFTEQKYRIKPEPGMLVTFPSDHRFRHTALPTRSGIRYALVSWAKKLGTPNTPKWANLARVDIYQQAKM